MILCLVNTCYSLYTVKRYKREYTIDKRDFEAALVHGITNFLASAVLSETNAAPSVSSRFPTVLAVPYGFYEDIRREKHIILNGVEYSVGDFCEYGLILSIVEKSFYCQQEDGSFAVVKMATSANAQGAPDAQAAAAPDAAAASL